MQVVNGQQYASGNQPQPQVIQTNVRYNKYTAEEYAQIAGANKDKDYYTEVQHYDSNNQLLSARGQQYSSTNSGLGVQQVAAQPQYEYVQQQYVQEPQQAYAETTPDVQQVQYQYVQQEVPQTTQQYYSSSTSTLPPVSEAYRALLREHAKTPGVNEWNATSPYEYTDHQNVQVKDPQLRSFYELPKEVRAQLGAAPDVPVNYLNIVNSPPTAEDGSPLRDDITDVNQSMFSPGPGTPPNNGTPPRSFFQTTRQFPHNPASPLVAEGLLSFATARIHILAQRFEERVDAEPCVHFTDFVLYDEQGRPMDLSTATASCQRGSSPLGQEPYQILTEQHGKKFCRKEFGKYPLDFEIELGHTMTPYSYSFRTADTMEGRDPIAWQFQAFVEGQWLVLHEEHDYATPTKRWTICGPFPLQGQQFYNGPLPTQQVVGNTLHTPVPRTRSRRFNPVSGKALHDLMAEGCRANQDGASVAELLRKGADPDYRDHRNRTTFIKACHNAPIYVIQLLINAGADVNARAQSGETGLHRLSLWGETEAMEALLRAGANPNRADEQGDTPLMIAAARGDSASVRLLLQYGASPAILNNKNQSALDMLQEELRKGHRFNHTDDIQAMLTQMTPVT
eukprot:TRINITY_DN67831_c1_g1_i1.p1 TRINITY_DN67831_c1_g1~~TRINITY_DN67831_c1_g1_i1.p1  ORF type:complete len:622 (-),score=48.85 TRINITY_DN67831_c1_g1_i1:174-2039(-)